MNAETRLQDQRQSTQQSADRHWPELVLLIGISLYLYLNLFTFSNIPYYLEGDQTWFRANALRMLHGERIYLDFFQFTPPGADIFYLVLLKLFGLHIWIMNAAVLLLGVALCCLCFSLAKLFIERKFALLATAFFLILCYAGLLDATHHWFSLLAVLCAVRILMPTTTSARIASAGAFLGLASFFTQTTGAVCGIAFLLFLIWEGWNAGRPWRRILGNDLTLIATFALTLGILGAYFVAESGGKQIWYFLITYPQHFVAYGDHRVFPRLHRGPTWRSLLDPAEYLFLYTLPMAIYPAVLWLCWRQRHKPGTPSADFHRWGGELAIPEREQLVLVSLAGLALFLQVITVVNRIRIYSISMFSIILLFWMVARTRRLRMYAMIAGWIIVAGLAIQQTRARRHQYPRIAALPVGKAALTEERYQQVYWLLQHTRPGDIFYQTAWPGFYFSLDLRSPVFVDVLETNEITRPEWVALTIQQVEDKQVKYILNSPWLYVQLNPSRPWEDHLEPFRAYLRTHYTRIHVFSNKDEIWQRN